MVKWIRRIFARKHVFANAATNNYYIEKYKDFDKVIKTYYQAKDHNGKLVNLDGIINPLKVDNRQLCAPTDD